MKDDAELRAHLREPHDEARAHDNWSAIATRRRAASVPSGSRPFAWLSLGRLAIGGGVTLAIACALFFVWPSAPGPLRQSDGSVATGLVTPESFEDATLALDDGSRVSLDTGTRLEILENAGDHVRFWLHEGSASFDVVPGGPRRWAIESGLVTVEVLGTSFRVEHRAHEVEVSVTRGTVLVRGPTAPGGIQRLHAGDRIVVPLETPATTTTAAADTHDEASTAPAIDEAITAIEPTSTTRVSRSTVTALDTTTRDTAEPRTTTPTRVEATASTQDAARSSAEIAPRDRMREADALRRAGRLDEAVALLGAIALDPSADDRALAAFTLGRLELDRRQHPREAAEAFSRAIELGIRAPLLEDARARRVQALSRFDRAAAESAAADYDTHHPEGRWHDEVHAWSHAP